MEIPRTLGQVQETFQGRERLVIHIQDLHCHYEVQKNIYGLISLLAKNHSLKLVGIEGASRPVDAGWVRSFPLPEARDAVCDLLVRQGRLSGVEWYAAAGEKPLTVEGVEDPALYAADRRSVNILLQDEAQGYVQDLRDLLSSLKQRLYSAEARRLEHAREQYRSGHTTLRVYARLLWQAARGRSLDEAGFPWLRKYLRAGSEQDQPGDEPDRVLSEMDRLVWLLLDQQAIQPEQRELVQWDRRLDTIERLLNIAALPEELAQFRGAPGAYRAEAFLAFARRQGFGEGADESDLANLDHYLDAAFEFYRVADERSQALAQRLLSRMAEHGEKLAVVVTGGYHSEHVVAALKEQGVSVVSIRPRLTRQDLVNPYFSLLKGQRTSLEKLLSQDQKMFSPEPSLPQVERAGEQPVESKMSPGERLFFRQFDLLAKAYGLLRLYQSKVAGLIERLRGGERFREQVRERLTAAFSESFRDYRGAEGIELQPQTFTLHRTGRKWLASFTVTLPGGLESLAVAWERGSNPPLAETRFIEPAAELNDYAFRIIHPDQSAAARKQLRESERAEADWFKSAVRAGLGRIIPISVFLVVLALTGLARADVAGHALQDEIRMGINPALSNWFWLAGLSAGAWIWSLLKETDPGNRATSDPNRLRNRLWKIMPGGSLEFQGYPKQLGRRLLTDLGDAIVTDVWVDDKSGNIALAGKLNLIGGHRWLGEAKNIALEFRAGQAVRAWLGNPFQASGNFEKPDCTVPLFWFRSPEHAAGWRLIGKNIICLEQNGRLVPQRIRNDRLDQETLDWMEKQASVWIKHVEYNVNGGYSLGSGASRQQKQRKNRLAAGRRGSVHLRYGQVVLQTLGDPFPDNDLTQKPSPSAGVLYFEKDESLEGWTLAGPNILYILREGRLQAEKVLGDEIDWQDLLKLDEVFIKGVDLSQTRNTQLQKQFDWSKDRTCLEFAGQSVLRVCGGQLRNVWLGDPLPDNQAGKPVPVALMVFEDQAQMKRGPNGAAAGYLTEMERIISKTTWGGRIAPWVNDLRELWRPDEILELIFSRAMAECPRTLDTAGFWNAFLDLVVRARYHLVWRQDPRVRSWVRFFGRLTWDKKLEATRELDKYLPRTTKMVPSEWAASHEAADTPRESRSLDQLTPLDLSAGLLNTLRVLRQSGFFPAISEQRFLTALRRVPLLERNEDRILPLVLSEIRRNDQPLFTAAQVKRLSDFGFRGFVQKDGLWPLLSKWQGRKRQVLPAALIWQALILKETPERIIQYLDLFHHTRSRKGGTLLSRPSSAAAILSRHWELDELSDLIRRYQPLDSFNALGHILYSPLTYFELSDPENIQALKKAFNDRERSKVIEAIKQQRSDPDIREKLILRFLKSLTPELLTTPLDEARVRAAWRSGNGDAVDLIWPMIRWDRLCRLAPGESLRRWEERADPADFPQINFEKLTERAALLNRLFEEKLNLQSPWVFHYALRCFKGNETVLDMLRQMPPGPGYIWRHAFGAPRSNAEVFELGKVFRERQLPFDHLEKVLDSSTHPGRALQLLTYAGVWKDWSRPDLFQKVLRGRAEVSDILSIVERARTVGAPLSLEQIVDLVRESMTPQAGRDLRMFLLLESPRGDTAPARPSPTAVWLEKIFGENVLDELGSICAGDVQPARPVQWKTVQEGIVRILAEGMGIPSSRLAQAIRVWRSTYPRFPIMGMLKTQLQLRSGLPVAPQLPWLKRLLDREPLWSKYFFSNLPAARPDILQWLMFGSLNNQAADDLIEQNAQDPECLWAVLTEDVWKFQNRVAPERIVFVQAQGQRIRLRNSLDDWLARIEPALAWSIEARFRYGLATLADVLMLIRLMASGADRTQPLAIDLFSVRNFISKNVQSLQHDKNTLAGFARYFNGASSSSALSGLSYPDRMLASLVAFREYPTTVETKNGKLAGNVWERAREWDELFESLKLENIPRILDGATRLAAAEEKPATSRAKQHEKKQAGPWPAWTFLLIAVVGGWGILAAMAAVTGPPNMLTSFPHFDLSLLAQAISDMRTDLFRLGTDLGIQWMPAALPLIVGRAETARMSLWPAPSETPAFLPPDAYLEGLEKIEVQAKRAATEKLEQAGVAETFREAVLNLRQTQWIDMDDFIKDLTQEKVPTFEAILKNIRRPYGPAEVRLFTPAMVKSLRAHSFEYFSRNSLWLWSYLPKLERARGRNLGSLLIGALAVSNKFPKELRDRLDLCARFGITDHPAHRLIMSSKANSELEAIFSELERIKPGLAKSHGPVLAASELTTAEILAPDHLQTFAKLRPKQLTEEMRQIKARRGDVVDPVRQMNISRLRSRLAGAGWVKEQDPVWAELSAGGFRQEGEASAKLLGRVMREGEPWFSAADLKKVRERNLRLDRILERFDLLEELSRFRRDDLTGFSGLVASEILVNPQSTEALGEQVRDFGRLRDWMLCSFLSASRADKDRVVNLIEAQEIEDTHLITAMLFSDQPIEWLDKLLTWNGYDSSRQRHLVALNLVSQKAGLDDIFHFLGWCDRTGNSLDSAQVAELIDRSMPGDEARRAAQRLSLLLDFKGEFLSPELASGNREKAYIDIREKVRSLNPETLLALLKKLNGEEQAVQFMSDLVRETAHDLKIYEKLAADYQERTISYLGKGLRATDREEVGRQISRLLYSLDPEVRRLTRRLIRQWYRNQPVDQGSRVLQDVGRLNGLEFERLLEDCSVYKNPAAGLQFLTRHVYAKMERYQREKISLVPPLTIGQWLKSLRQAGLLDTKYWERLKSDLPEDPKQRDAGWAWALSVLKRPDGRMVFEPGQLKYLSAQISVQTLIARTPAWLRFGRDHNWDLDSEVLANALLAPDLENADQKVAAFGQEPAMLAAALRSPLTAQACSRALWRMSEKQIAIPDQLVILKNIDKESDFIKIVDELEAETGSWNQQRTQDLIRRITERADQETRRGPPSEAWILPETPVSLTDRNQDRGPAGLELLAQPLRRLVQGGVMTEATAQSIVERVLLGASEHEVLALLVNNLRRAGNLLQYQEVFNAEQRFDLIQNLDLRRFLERVPLIDGTYTFRHRFGKYYGSAALAAMIQSPLNEADTLKLFHTCRNAGASDKALVFIFGSELPLQDLIRRIEELEGIIAKQPLTLTIAEQALALTGSEWRWFMQGARSVPAAQASEHIQRMYALLNNQIRLPLLLSWIDARVQAGDWKAAGTQILDRWVREHEAFLKSRLIFMVQRGEELAEMQWLLRSSPQSWWMLTRALDARELYEEIMLLRRRVFRARLPGSTPTRALQILSKQGWTSPVAKAASAAGGRLIRFGEELFSRDRPAKIRSQTAALIRYLGLGFPVSGYFKWVRPFPEILDRLPMILQVVEALPAGARRSALLQMIHPEYLTLESLAGLIDAFPEGSLITPSAVLGRQAKDILIGNYRRVLERAFETGLNPDDPESDPVWVLQLRGLLARMRSETIRALLIYLNLGQYLETAMEISAAEAARIKSAAAASAQRVAEGLSRETRVGERLGSSDPSHAGEGREQGGIWDFISEILVAKVIGQPRSSEWISQRVRGLDRQGRSELHALLRMEFPITDEDEAPDEESPMARWLMKLLGEKNWKDLLAELEDGLGPAPDMQLDPLQKQIIELASQAMGVPFRRLHQALSQSRSAYPEMTVTHLLTRQLSLRQEIPRQVAHLLWKNQEPTRPELPTKPSRSRGPRLEPPAAPRTKIPTDDSLEYLDRLIRWLTKQLNDTDEHVVAKLNQWQAVQPGRPLVVILKDQYERKWNFTKAEEDQLGGIDFADRKLFDRLSAWRRDHADGPLPTEEEPPVDLESEIPWPKQRDLLKTLLSRAPLWTRYFNTRPGSLREDTLHWMIFDPQRTTAELEALVSRYPDDPDALWAAFTRPWWQYQQAAELKETVRIEQTARGLRLAGDREEWLKGVEPSLAQALRARFTYKHASLADVMLLMRLMAKNPKRKQNLPLAFEPASVGGLIENNVQKEKRPQDQVRLNHFADFADLDHRGIEEEDLEKTPLAEIMLASLTAFRKIETQYAEGKIRKEVIAEWNEFLKLVGFEKAGKIVQGATRLAEAAMGKPAASRAEPGQKRHKFTWPSWTFPLILGVGGYWLGLGLDWLGIQSGYLLTAGMAGAALMVLGVRLWSTWQMTFGHQGLAPPTADDMQARLRELPLDTMNIPNEWRTWKQYPQAGMPKDLTALTVRFEPYSPWRLFFFGGRAAYFNLDKVSGEPLLVLPMHFARYSRARQDAILAHELTHYVRWMSRAGAQAPQTFIQRLHEEWQAIRQEMRTRVRSVLGRFEGLGILSPRAFFTPLTLDEISGVFSDDEMADWVERGPRINALFARTGNTRGWIQTIRLVKALGHDAGLRTMDILDQLEVWETQGRVNVDMVSRALELMSFRHPRVAYAALVTYHDLLNRMLERSAERVRNEWFLKSGRLAADLNTLLHGSRSILGSLAVFAHLRAEMEKTATEDPEIVPARIIQILSDTARRVRNLGSGAYLNLLKDHVGLEKVEIRSAGNAPNGAARLVRHLLETVPEISLPVPQGYPVFAAESPARSLQSLTFDTLVRKAGLHGQVKLEKISGRNLIYRDERGWILKVKLNLSREPNGALQVNSERAQWERQRNPRADVPVPVAIDTNPSGEPEYRFLLDLDQDPLRKQEIRKKLNMSDGDMRPDEGMPGQQLIFNIQVNGWLATASLISPVSDQETYLHPQHVRSRVELEQAFRATVRTWMNHLREGLIYTTPADLFHDFNDDRVYIISTALLPQGLPDIQYTLGNLMAWRKTVGQVNISRKGEIRDRKYLIPLMTVLQDREFKKESWVKVLAELHIPGRNLVLFETLMRLDLTLSLILGVWEDRQPEIWSGISWMDDASLEPTARMFESLYGQQLLGMLSRDAGQQVKEWLGLIDWARLARNHAFFMSPAYIPYVQGSQEFPAKALYGLKPDRVVLGTFPERSWDPQVGLVDRDMHSADRRQDAMLGVWNGPLLSDIATPGILLNGLAIAALGIEQEEARWRAEGSPWRVWNARALRVLRARASLARQAFNRDLNRLRPQAWRTWLVWGAFAISVLSLIGLAVWVWNGLVPAGNILVDPQLSVPAMAGDANPLVAGWADRILGWPETVASWSGWTAALSILPVLGRTPTQVWPADHRQLVISEPSTDIVQILSALERSGWLSRAKFETSFSGLPQRSRTDERFFRMVLSQISRDGKPWFSESEMDELAARGPRAFLQKIAAWEWMRDQDPQGNLITGGLFVKLVAKRETWPELLEALRLFKQAGFGPSSIKRVLETGRSVEEHQAKLEYIEKNFKNRRKGEGLSATRKRMLLACDLTLRELQDNQENLVACTDVLLPDTIRKIQQERLLQENQSLLRNMDALRMKLTKLHLIFNEKNYTAWQRQIDPSSPDASRRCGEALLSSIDRLVDGRSVPWLDGMSLTDMVNLEKVNQKAALIGELYQRGNRTHRPLSPKEALAAIQNSRSDEENLRILNHFAATPDLPKILFGVLSSGRDFESVLRMMRDLQGCKPYAELAKASLPVKHDEARVRELLKIIRPQNGRLAMIYKAALSRSVLPEQFLQLLHDLTDRGVVVGVLEMHYLARLTMSSEPGGMQDRLSAQLLEFHEALDSGASGANKFDAELARELRQLPVEMAATLADVFLPAGSYSGSSADLARSLLQRLGETVLPERVAQGGKSPEPKPMNRAGDVKKRRARSITDLKAKQDQLNHVYLKKNGVWTLDHVDGYRFFRDRVHPQGTQDAVQITCLVKHVPGVIMMDAPLSLEIVHGKKRFRVMHPGFPVTDDLTFEYELGRVVRIWAGDPFLADDPDRPNPAAVLVYFTEPGYTQPDALAWENYLEVPGSQPAWPIAGKNLFYRIESHHGRQVFIPLGGTIKQFADRMASGEHFIVRRVKLDRLGGFPVQMMAWERMLGMEYAEVTVEIDRNQVVCAWQGDRFPVLDWNEPANVREIWGREHGIISILPKDAETEMHRLWQKKCFDQKGAMRRIYQMTPNESESIAAIYRVMIDNIKTDSKTFYPGETIDEALAAINRLRELVARDEISGENGGQTPPASPLFELALARTLEHLKEQVAKRIRTFETLREALPPLQLRLKDLNGRLSLKLTEIKGSLEERKRAWREITQAQNRLQRKLENLDYSNAKRSLRSAWQTLEQIAREQETIQRKLSRIDELAGSREAERDKLESRRVRAQDLERRAGPLPKELVRLAQAYRNLEKRRLRLASPQPIQNDVNAQNTTEKSSAMQQLEKDFQSLQESLDDWLSSYQRVHTGLQDLETSMARDPEPAAGLGPEGVPGENAQTGQQRTEIEERLQTALETAARIRERLSAEEMEHGRESKAAGMRQTRPPKTGENFRRPKQNGNLEPNEKFLGSLIDPAHVRDLILRMRPDFPAKIPETKFSANLAEIVMAVHYLRRRNLSVDFERLLDPKALVEDLNGLTPAQSLWTDYPKRLLLSMTQNDLKRIAQIVAKNGGGGEERVLKRFGSLYARIIETQQFLWNRSRNNGENREVPAFGPSARKNDLVEILLGFLEKSLDSDFEMELKQYPVEIFGARREVKTEELLVRGKNLQEQALEKNLADNSRANEAMKKAASLVKNRQALFPMAVKFLFISGMWTVELGGLPGYLLYSMPSAEILKAREIIRILMEYFENKNKQKELAKTNPLINVYLRLLNSVGDGLRNEILAFLTNNENLDRNLMMRILDDWKGNLAEEKNSESRKIPGTAKGKSEDLDMDDDGEGNSERWVAIEDEIGNGNGRKAPRPTDHYDDSWWGSGELLARPLLWMTTWALALWAVPLGSIPGSWIHLMWGGFVAGAVGLALQLLRLSYLLVLRLASRKEMADTLRTGLLMERMIRVGGRLGMDADAVANHRIELLPDTRIGFSQVALGLKLGEGALGVIRLHPRLADLLGTRWSWIADAVIAHELREAQARREGGWFERVRHHAAATMSEFGYLLRNLLGRIGRVRRDREEPVRLDLAGREAGDLSPLAGRSWLVVPRWVRGIFTRDWQLRPALRPLAWLWSLLQAAGWMLVSVGANVEKWRMSDPDSALWVRRALSLDELQARKFDYSGVQFDGFDQPWLTRLWRGTLWADARREGDRLVLQIPRRLLQTAAGSPWRQKAESLLFLIAAQKAMNRAEKIEGERSPAGREIRPKTGSRIFSLAARSLLSLSTPLPNRLHALWHALWMSRSPLVYLRAVGADHLVLEQSREAGELRWAFMNFARRPTIFARRRFEQQANALLRRMPGGTQPRLSGDLDRLRRFIPGGNDPARRRPDLRHRWRMALQAA